MPSYLPAPAVTVVPWTERYVAALARRNPAVSREELWDEAVAALLRAAVYFRDGAGTFRRYAQLSVQRACWRYVLPDRRYGHNVRRPLVVAEPEDLLQETASSAEDEALGREAAAEAWARQVVLTVEPIPGPGPRRVRREA